MFIGHLAVGLGLWGSRAGTLAVEIAALRNVAMISWIFVPWASWIDRSREVRARAV